MKRREIEREGEREQDILIQKKKQRVKEGGETVGEEERNEKSR